MGSKSVRRQSSKQFMTAVGPRQLSLLALAAGMVLLGVLGLTGFVTPGPVLAATFLAVAIILAFDAGRRFTTLR